MKTTPVQKKQSKAAIAANEAANLDSPIETIMAASNEVTMEQALAEEKALAAEQAAKEKAEKAAKVAADKAAKKEAAEKAKAEKDAEKAKAKAEKEAAKVAKPERVKQNDVTRPALGTKTGTVWAIADDLSTAKNSPVSINELRVETDKISANPNMVTAQYASWKKFYGITGRIANPLGSSKSLDKLKAALEKATAKLILAQDAHAEAAMALHAAQGDVITTEE